MTDDDKEIEGEERAIYAIIGVASLPIVLFVMADGKLSFDAGTTISLALVVLAAIGLWQLLRPRDRVPTARVIKK